MGNISSIPGAVASSAAFEFLKKTLFRPDVLFILILLIAVIWLYYKFSNRKKFYYRSPVQSFFDEYTQIDQYITSEEQGIVKQEQEQQQHQEQEKPKRKKEDIWKNEEKCRKICEKLFNKPFKSCRPDFLKNPVTNKNLELDMYNEELKLSVEVDGKQHAEYTPHFHRHGVKEFQYQITKDDFKTKKCKLEGIDLIRVPHFISPDSLEKYIVREIRKIRRFSDYSLNTYLN